MKYVPSKLHTKRGNRLMLSGSFLFFCIIFYSARRAGQRDDFEMSRRVGACVNAYL